MSLDKEFELPLGVNFPRAVSGIPFVFAQTKIEEALKIKREIEDFEIRTTHTTKSAAVERWSNDLSTAKRGNVTAPVVIEPTHPVAGTGVTWREIANSVRDLDPTAYEGQLKYIASAIPVTEAMTKMADGGLDGIEKVNISQSADASKHISAVKQGLGAMSIANIFAPAAIESGLIGPELKGHLRSALVTHCIGPDGSYCWKDFSDGTVLSTIAEAMVGRRPDMDLASALCFVAPLQHDKDRFKLQGCHWWFQRHNTYAAF